MLFFWAPHKPSKTWFSLAEIMFFALLFMVLRAPGRIRYSPTHQDGIGRLNGHLPFLFAQFEEGFIFLPPLRLPPYEADRWMAPFVAVVRRIKYGWWRQVANCHVFRSWRFQIVNSTGGIRVTRGFFLEYVSRFSKHVWSRIISVEWRILPIKAWIIYFLHHLVWYGRSEHMLVSEDFATEAAFRMKQFEHEEEDTSFARGSQWQVATCRLVCCLLLKCCWLF